MTVKRHLQQQNVIQKQVNFLFYSTFPSCSPEVRREKTEGDTIGASIITFFLVHQLITHITLPAKVKIQVNQTHISRFLAYTVTSQTKILPTRLILIRFVFSPFSRSLPN